MCRAAVPADDGEHRRAAVAEPPAARAGRGGRLRRARLELRARTTPGSCCCLWTQPQRLRRRGSAVPPRRRLLRLLAARCTARSPLAARDRRRWRPSPRSPPTRPPGPSQEAAARACARPRAPPARPRGAAARRHGVALAARAVRARASARPVRARGDVHRRDGPPARPAGALDPGAGGRGACACTRACDGVPRLARRRARADRRCSRSRRRATCRPRSIAFSVEPQALTRERPHVDRRDRVHPPRVRARPHRVRALPRRAAALRAATIARARADDRATCRSGTRACCGPR